MADVKIEKVEWGMLEGRRPRFAGENARIGKHGQILHLPVVRVTDSEGFSGFGYCWNSSRATAILSKPLTDLFDIEVGVLEPGRDIESALWDLFGHRTGQPVYKLTASIARKAAPDAISVPCYDTSLYFDDLHLSSHSEAADLIAVEAAQGLEKGHQAFKIKVGRGARHMDLMPGMDRDVAIIRAVRKTVGPDCRIMIDANNGYNLNITKLVLSATADCNLHWLEEAFHEDDALYDDLKRWMTEQSINAMIADGEGLASSELLNWATRGLIDVIQYDILGHGLTNWLCTGKQLDEWNVQTAPHAYGNHLANFVSAHLSTAVDNFALLEWDEAETPGLDTSAYRIENGCLIVPNSPGFGLKLEDDTFAAAVQKSAQPS